MDRVQCVVIGAGVVGLACARALAQAGREVLLLEAADGIGTGTSSRNSEVIHAGIYYPPGSLKGRFCVRGKALLYAFCAAHGVRAQRVGKLIVATERSQCARLNALVANAAALGVHDLVHLTQAEAQAMEPALSCVAAVHSPSSGMVDSHAYMLALQGEFEQAGGITVLYTRVQSVQQQGADWIIETAEGIRLACSQWVNSAGLHAPLLARRIRLADDAAQARWLARLPTHRYAKGNYFTLAGRAPFSRLVYPLPRPDALGTHFSLDQGGQARFGPDIEWLDTLDPDAIDYRVNPAQLPEFYADIRHYWPALPDGALLPGYTGVRPKLHAHGEPAADFFIEGPAQHGLPGFVNLMGIESPGLTASLAIAEHVETLLT
ncbi:MAG TPA: NAD(P)/FAD-dependent oxidoreductase [Burkholderiaceae bacterium]|nr:NAD(P)/FAD-dependent oxidoreductase [Burkholderiaceae bacterium]